MSGSEFADLHDDLRTVAREILGRGEDADTTWRRAAEAGWLGLEIAEEFDGSGVTFEETAVVLEELGRAAVDGPFLGAVLGAAAAQATPPSPERDGLLRDIASGTARVAVAFAVDGEHRADAADPTPFTLAAGVLRGAASHVVDAPSADVFLVVATQTDDAARPAQEPVLVRVRRDQVACTDQVVLDASRSLGNVVADGVAVAGDDVWHFAGDPSAAVPLLADRAAVALAIDAMGVASAMLDATVDYVGLRHQFDRPIGSFQAVKHQCADGLVQLRVGRELLDAAVAAVASDDDDRPLHVARANAFLTAAAVDVVGTAMQLHGGIGYTWESGIHRYLKRALLDRALLGSPADHRRRIGISLRRKSDG